MSPAEEISCALRRLRRRRVMRWGSTRAAMAVTVVTGAGGAAVLLTRHVDARCGQPGELALPGGWAARWEPAPSAARRRLATHLGIHLPPEAVLGRLDDYRTQSRLVITPVVLWAGDVAECSELYQAPDVLAVPLPDLDVEPVFVGSAESDHPVIRLPLHGEWLHAPTAAVLHQFREVVLHRRRTRVAHLQQPELTRR